MRRVIVFDVNETLLDLSVLDTPFAAAFSSSAARGEWFARLLHLSTVATVVGVYRDLGELGAAALDATAAARGLRLDASTREDILGTMRSLPAHDDAVEGLEALSAAGFRLAALTNSGSGSALATLDRAGLRPFFEEICSVEASGVFKPRPEPYRDTAKAMGVDIDGVRMVAAHDWDLAGAAVAGAATAFLRRPGKTYADVLPAPDLEATTLPELARRIMSVDDPA